MTWQVMCGSGSPTATWRTIIGKVLIGILEDLTLANRVSCAAGPGSTIRSACARRIATSARRTAGVAASGSVARGGPPELLSPEFWSLNPDSWRLRGVDLVGAAGGERSTA